MSCNLAKEIPHQAQETMHQSSHMPALELLRAPVKPMLKVRVREHPAGEK